MARLILKCPYFKGGNKRASAHLGNLVNYIATRDGVEKIKVKDINNLSSEKQNELINQIIKEFPNTKNLFEYEDYIKNPSIENASEFISIALEENFDKIGKRKNYVDYISNRPGVERIGTHGLFTGGDDSLVLSRIADEVASHEGNVWTPIISLRREDAERLGFDNAESWHNMLSYYAIDIAESLKIKPENFRWYAAFHNEGHHPHVHMVCYSANSKEGYLTKKGIEKMKSGFVKHIFGQELKEIYIKQSERRDELKEESREVLLQLIDEIKNGGYQNNEVEELFIEFADRLKSNKGKKQYGYLQPKLKAMVDEIVDEIAKDERIDKAYGLWYEMRNEVLNSYMDNLPDPLPLSKQKEFKSIRNMVIKEADNFNKGTLFFEEITSDDVNIIGEEIDQSAEDVFENDIKFIGIENDKSDLFDEIEIDDTTEDVYVKWTGDYKRACKFLYGTDDIIQDFEDALYLFQSEAEKGNALAMFNMGRIFANGLGVEINMEESYAWYEKALNAFHKVEDKKPWKYTEYRIGKMYLQGLGIEEDYEKAAYWLGLSADEGYKFAEYSLGGLYYRGQGVEQSYKKAFDLYLKASKQGFPYAEFEVAKMYRDGIGTEVNMEKADKYFSSAFIGFKRLEKQSGDDKIQYRLGWMLQNGIRTEKDIEEAKEYYEKSAKLGNTFASYSLGKIYLMGEGVPRDKEEAIRWFTLSAEQGNEYAQFFLDNMDKFYNPSVSFVVSKMFHHMSKTFEDSTPLQSSNIGKRIDGKLLRKLRQKRMAQGHKRDDYGQERTDL